MGRSAGEARARDLAAQAVHVSTGFGAAWRAMAVRGPANRHARRAWSGLAATLPDGRFEVWCRAADSGGRTQPHAAANRNPQG